MTGNAKKILAAMLALCMTFQGTLPALAETGDEVFPAIAESADFDEATPSDAAGETFEEGSYVDTASEAEAARPTSLLLGGDGGADSANAIVMISYNGKTDIIKLGQKKPLLDILAAVGIDIRWLRLLSASTDEPDLFDFTDGSITLLKKFTGNTVLHTGFYKDNPGYHVNYDFTVTGPQYTIVNYIDEGGQEKTQECVALKNAETHRFMPGVWYAVTGDVTVSGRISNDAPESEPAHLILTDGCHLTVKGGINTATEKGLNIYAQSEGTGRLTISSVAENSAGIGGGWQEGCGTITVSGGVISINGTRDGAGIGSGLSSDNRAITGKVIINRGDLTIHAADFAPAIGSGCSGSALKEVVVNGGTLNLYGAYRGAGIGGGSIGAGTDVTVNNGKLAIYGGDGAPAIGTGTDYLSQGDLKVSDALNFYALDETGSLVRMSVDEYKTKRTGYVAIGTSEEEETYTVHHLLQKVDLSGYEEAPDSPETYYGLVGSMTVAGKKHFDGFRSRGVTEQLITKESRLELEVKHDRNQYKLYFNLNGRGSGAPDTITACYGAGIEEPSVKPTAEGFIFGGWYKEEGCTNKFEFTTMPAESLTVFAKWIPIEYTITWKDEDRILRQDKHIYGDKPEYGTDPLRTGYRFTGWEPALTPVTKDATYTAEFEIDPSQWHTITWKMDNGETIDTMVLLEGEMPEHDPVRKEGYLFAGWNPFVVRATSDATYTAMFVECPPDKLSVSFDTAGGRFIPPQVIAKGQTASKPADPTKEGCIFAGWFADDSCTVTFDFAKAITADTTVYAKWEKAPKKKHTIRWMLNDIILIDSTEVPEGEMPVHGNPSVEGYIFIGWKPALAPATENAKYTAYFEERGTDKIAVTFNTDGGTFINTQVIDRYSTPLKPADPQKAGCAFEGWYREAGFVTPYKFNEPFNTDMTLYAKWEVLPPVVHTVAWMLNDIILIDSTEVPEGEMPVHGNPSVEGYIFIGWKPALAPVTNDITYTARFEKRSPDKAAVTFHTDGGSFVETQVITKEQKAVRPSDPVKTGYEFVNWYADAAFAALYDFSTAVTADITVYAKWKKTAGREYTITWKDWDGKTLAAVKVEEGGLPVYPLSSKPSRSGYIFTGWNKDITLATTDTTYTATYEPKSSGGGGGGSSALSAKKAAVTFSPNWYADIYGVWRIKNSAGQVVTNAWLCDDAVDANGQNVWYLLGSDGAMLAAGLVQDNTGNFYSLETNHDGYFGMLRYTDGYYNCNGQQVYLKFSHEHIGSFGAIINADGIEKLKAIYGVTQYGIGNESAVYTKTF